MKKYATYFKIIITAKAMKYSQYVYVVNLIHCVANVYAVWPVYTVICLCSRGWE